MYIKTPVNICVYSYVYIYIHIMCYVYIITPMYTLYIYVCCIHGCIHGFTFMYTPQPGSENRERLLWLEPTVIYDPMKQFIAC